MQVGNIEPQVLFADRVADLVGQLLESGNKTDRVEVARTIADIHNCAVADGIKAGLTDQAVTAGTPDEQLGVLLSRILLTAHELRERDERTRAMASTAHDRLELIAVRNNGDTDVISREMFLAIEDQLSSVQAHKTIDECVEELQQRLIKQGTLRNQGEIENV